MGLGERAIDQHRDELLLGDRRIGLPERDRVERYLVVAHADEEEVEEKEKEEEEEF